MSVYSVVQLEQTFPNAAAIFDHLKPDSYTFHESALVLNFKPITVNQSLAFTSTELEIIDKPSFLTAYRKENRNSRRDILEAFQKEILDRRQLKTEGNTLNR